MEYETSRDSKGTLSVHLTGRLDVSSTAKAYRSLFPLLKKERLKKRKRHPVTIDLSHLDYMDDFGSHMLLHLEAKLAGFGVELRFGGPSQVIQDFLEQTALEIRDVKADLQKAPRLGLITRLGTNTLRHTANTRYMISFLGSVILCMLKLVIRPKLLRVEDTITQMEKTGVDALPIVAMISFLLGLIMAFMSAMQLRQFGANLYVASLVSFAMVSELGPIMTAIIVAGRSGSAYAAEIGTMKISEEIDALFVMGFDPTLFLAVPRIVAAMIMVPLLTLFSDLFAILGGMVIGVSMLDLSAGKYMTQTIETLSLFEFAWGSAKSMVFAALVAWTGCLRGFQARGGAAAVGNAATSAVVSAIFLIILFDSIFAVIRSYW